MAVLLVAIGLGAVLAALLDVVWTAAAAGAGAGPISGRISARLWRLALAVGGGPDGPRHTFLTVAGIGLIVTVVLLWAATVWLGWALVFSATDGAVVDTTTGGPASSVERLQFAGASLFSLTTSRLSAGAGAWQFAAIGATATGVVLVTLAISYFVPVATALAEARQLGAYVACLGDGPEDLVARAYADGTVRSLEPHLIALTPMVHALAERYLTYPVLQYVHSSRDHTSPALGLVVLDEVLTLVRVAVVPEARPRPQTVEPLVRAIGWYLDTIASTFVAHPPGPVPAADLEALRRAGVPTVDDKAYEEAVEREVPRRCQLARLLIDDGWSPEAWERRVRDT